jgi:hypothetical protein
MKKQILFETVSLVAAFAGIVYAVFAASFAVGVVAIIALVGILFTTLKEA